EGSYAISVVISDAGGAKTTAASSATVADAALSATGKALAPTEGAAFSGVVASFSDTDPAGALSDYTVTITWGDGQSSAGTVSASGTSFLVTGSNTYAEEGSYGISVVITDAGGAKTTAASS